MSLASIFQRFSEWLTRRAEWEQGVIGGLILAFLLGLVPTLQWIARRVAAHRRNRRVSADARHAAIEADFQSGKAELGVVDHGVISTASLDAIKGLLLESIPAIQRLYEEVFGGETIHKALANEDATYRQKLLKDLARRIHPAVRTLEGVAERLGPLSTEFIEAYRVLLLKGQYLTEADRRNLAETRAVFTGDFATMYKRHAEYLASYRTQLAAVEGKQQDLTRMVQRSRKALSVIDESMTSVATFCSGEMAHTIDSILNGGLR